MLAENWVSTRLVTVSTARSAKFCPAGAAAGTVIRSAGGTRGDGKQERERGGGNSRGPHVARIVPEATQPEGAEPAW